MKNEYDLTKGRTVWWMTLTKKEGYYNDKMEIYNSACYNYNEENSVHM